MAEERKDQVAQEQAPEADASAEAVQAEETTPTVAEVETPATPEKKSNPLKSIMLKLKALNIDSVLQKITTNKWVQLADKISRIVALLSICIAGYLGLVGWGFDFAFICLLISTITTVYVSLLAGARLYLVRGGKRRVRKKALRFLVAFIVLLLINIWGVAFTQVPHRDGRFGGLYNIHGYDGIYYDIIEDETGEKVAKICDADTDAVSIVIPKEVHGYPVKYVYGVAFNNSPKLTIIDTPTSHEYFSSADGVLYSKDFSTLIAYPAGRNSITRAYTVHSKTTTIADCAFRNNRYLKTVDLGNVTTIGDNAFENAAALTTVNFSDKLTTISHNAFAGCTQIQILDIPENVTFVGNGAFSGFTSVQNIFIHASAENETLWSPSWKRNCSALIDRPTP